VHIGITEISGRRVSAILRVNAFQIVRNLVERLFPIDALPAGGSTSHWLSKPITVEVKIL
jgi:hypothetical protein